MNLVNEVSTLQREPITNLRGVLVGKRDILTKGVIAPEIFLVTGRALVKITLTKSVFAKIVAESLVTGGETIVCRYRIETGDFNFGTVFNL